MISSNMQLAYLPHKRHDLMLEDGNADLYITHDGNPEFPDGTSREEKKSRRNGLLNWLKSRVCTECYSQYASVIMTLFLFLVQGS